MTSFRRISDRRGFLSFLAASPILAFAGLTSRWVEDLMATPFAAQDTTALGPQNDSIIKSVKEALSVFDFDAAARSSLSPAHYSVLTEGSFNNETVRANREGFLKYQIHMRRLTGINKVDQSVRFFGVNWESPIFISPVGRINMFYPDGAAVVARAAKATHTLQILAASPQILSEPRGIEDVNAARGEPVWVDVSGGRPDQSLVRRIEATGCPTLVWAVDSTEGGNQVPAKSLQHARVANLDQAADSRCNGCHDSLPRVSRIEATTPMDVIGAVGGVSMASFSTASRAPSWEDINRVKDMTRMKLVLKGIETREDAALAVQHGADAIIVSNHGGHEDASGRGTIECLPEVLAGAAGKIPVFIDGGFRSGADVFKALALGATAVGIGRPHIWGLASFGQEGVETVIELLRRELQVVMAQTNAASIAKIRRDSLIVRT